MLRRVETETVNAVVAQRVEQVVDNIVLISGAAGVQIGERTAEIVLGHRSHGKNRKSAADWM